MTQLVFQNTARVGLAHLALLNNATFAWGGIAGGSSWTNNPPPVGQNNIDLIEELVRIQPTLTQFVNPNPSGSITVLNTKWDPSQTPTRHVYLEFKFAESAHPTDVIYQIALFMGARFVQAPLTEVTFSIAAASSGETTLNVSSFSGGTISDLLPEPTLSLSGGRLITFGGATYRINSINVSSNTITLSRPLEAPTLGSSATAIEMNPPTGDLILPSEVIDPGYLLLIQNIPPIYRNPAAKEQFYFVVSF